MSYPLLTLAVLLPSLGILASTEMPEPFAARWDEKVGLWFGSTKYGPEGHDIRANAGRLAKAGCLGLLDRVPAERVLANIRRAQATEGELRGNFWWAWEAKKVTDRNSGFFTTMQLLVLKYEFYAGLNERARTDLDRMLDEAVHWFRHKVLPPQPRKLRYPNAFLGDAVCLWLLRELDGSLDEAWRTTFGEILAYYRDQEWGWGEHLSDLYVKICQRELCALLMWAEDLDAETRTVAEGLLGELLAIDAAFAGGPRVPTVRCYWLDRTPRRPDHWPAWFKPYVEIADPERPLGEFVVAHLAAKRGLLADIEVPTPEGPGRDIPCHGRTRALAWVAPRWRLGTLTRYPFFGDTNDHAGYGLHWQSLPVAFWHVAGDWGYLQFAVEEKGEVHAHPAENRKIAQGRKLCRLSDTDRRARFGLTHGVRSGPALLVHRELPAVARGWTWMADRLRLVHPTAAARHVDERAGWTRLTATYGEEVLTVACRPLTPGVVVALTETDGEWRFAARCDLAGEAERPDRLRLVWFVTVADRAATPPILNAAERLRATFADAGAWRFDRKRGWRREE